MHIDSNVTRIEREKELLDRQLKKVAFQYANLYGRHKLHLAIDVNTRTNSASLQIIEKRTVM